MKSRIVAVILMVALSVTVLSVPAFAGEYLNGRYVSSRGAFVLDFDTGAELYSIDPDVPRIPASMTKLMTVYMVYEAIRRGDITYDTVVPISDNVYTLSRHPTLANVVLYEADGEPVQEPDVTLFRSEIYTVTEMLDVILVISACAATVALAELLSGTEESFVKKMNQRAAAMGIDAVFEDCYGLSDNNLITPRSMAVLSRRLVTDFPKVLDRTALSTVNFHGRLYAASNRLLRDIPYAGADGLKTGTTTLGGYCFAGTAVRAGRRIVTVTMYSSSTYQRFVDTHILLDYGFAQPVSVYEEQESPYRDIKPSDPYFDAVVFCKERGLMEGVGGDLFRPYGELTRAMVATVLYNIEGRPPVEYSDIFSDVPDGIWYSAPIMWAYENGIVGGYGDGTFGADANITREQIAAILYRYGMYSNRDLGTQADLSGYADAHSISDWAQAPVSWCVSEGIISGVTPAKLAPNGTVERAQYAFMLQRFIEGAEILEA